MEKKLISEGKRSREESRAIEGGRDGGQASAIVSV